MVKLNQVLLVSIIVLTFAQYCELRTLKQSEDLEAQKHRALASYFCAKYKTCTHGGNSVCGFDEDNSYLAVFEDYCTMLQVNCKGGGAKIFFQVEFSVCDIKSKHEYEFNTETSEFEHLSTTTEGPEPIVTRTRKPFGYTENKKQTTLQSHHNNNKITFPRMKWKTKPEILNLLLRRRFYMPFLK